MSLLDINNQLNRIRKMELRVNELETSVIKRAKLIDNIKAPTASISRGINLLYFFINR